MVGGLRNFSWRCFAGIFVLPSYLCHGHMMDVARPGGDDFLAPLGRGTSPEVLATVMWSGPWHLFGVCLNMMKLQY